MSNYKEQLIQILSNFDVKGSRALSIGNLNDDRKYFRSWAFDNWETMDIDSSVAPNYLFDINQDLIGNDYEFSLPEDLIEGFDHVFAFELWDYIWDPVRAHQNIYTLLKPNGVYMGSYPMLYCKHNPLGADMLRYTDDAIKKYLTKCGFRDINIIPRYGNDLILDFYRRDGMRMAKDFDHRIIGWVVEAKK